MALVDFFLFSTIGRRILGLTLGSALIGLLFGLLALAERCLEGISPEGALPFTIGGEELFREFWKRHQSEDFAANDAHSNKQVNERARDRDAYAILGVSPTATPQEIKAAFRRHLKIYHPDRVASMGPEIQALANDLTRKASDAYKELLQTGGPYDS